MDYPILLKKEYLQFRSSFRAFLNSKIKTHALAWENKAVFPGHLLKKFGSKNYLGLSIAKKDGGNGQDFWHEVILAEELATSGLLGWGLSVLVQTNMLAPLIAQLGTKEQKKEILIPALKGDFYLALAATESKNGSDLSAIATEAKLQNDYYLVNGEKKYITNGSVAKYIVASVRTLNTKNIWSLSLLIIPSKLKGFTQKKLKTSGLKTGDTGSLEFNNVKVPKKYLLGKPNQGFYYLLKGLQRERLVGAVALNALALNVLESTIRFLKSRTRFNEVLSKKQSIRHKIADLRARVEASRQFAYSVCEQFALGKPVDQEIVMLKIFSYELAQEVINECIHLHGAEGFMKDHWLSHVYQDSQAFTLAAGTTEIMKDLLSGMLQM